MHLVNGTFTAVHLPRHNGLYVGVFGLAKIPGVNSVCGVGALCGLGATGPISASSSSTDTDATMIRAELVYLWLHQLGPHCDRFQRLGLAWARRETWCLILARQPRSDS